MDDRPLSVRYAEKAAQALGFAFESLDPFSHHLARVSGPFGAVFIGAGAVSAYPLNAATAVDIARDKAHASAILARAGLPFPETGHFFVTDRDAGLRPPGRGVEEAVRFAATLGYPVFVKPNDGSRGRLAQSVADEDALRRHLAAIGAQHLIAIVQRRVRGRERRILALDGAPVATYVKTPPRLRADGIHTVRAQLAAVSDHQRAQGLGPVNLDDPVLAENLARLDVTLDDTLPAGATLIYAETANASLGGGGADLTTDVSAADRALVARLARLFGLRVFAVDLIEPPDAPPQILEINGNPALTTLERAGRDDLLLALWTTILTKAAEDAARRR